MQVKTEDQALEWQVAQPITVRRLRAGSVYKITLIGLLLGGFVPLSLLEAIFRLSGLATSTFTWNEQPLTGLWLLIGWLLVGGGLTLVWAGVVGSVMCLGLYLFSIFRPLILYTSGEFRQPEHSSGASAVDAGAPSVSLSHE
jgi:hypothetical protein